MKTEVRIAAFDLRRLPAIMAIERASFGAEAYGAALFRRLRRRSEGLFYVALAGRGVRGYVVGEVDGGTGEIISIAVAPEWRRAGVGRALLAHILQAMSERGATHAELAVRVENAAAMRFYRGFGFRRADRIARYYEDSGDAWVMRAVLRKAASSSRAKTGRG